MNLRVLVALGRWHLGRLGGLPLLVATPFLGWLTGFVAARASVTAVDPARLDGALAIAAAVFAVACASSPAAARASRSLLLFSAPLYGRELARALCLVPCCLATIFAIAALAGARSALLTPVVVAPIATLIVLSATLRDGWRARLYQLLALGSALLLTVLPSVLHWLAWLAVAATLGFLALRALGETLARYDPLTAS